MHHTVYRTTCTVNGKVYIGVHETDDPDDDYLGSGKLISRAVKKHGRAAFVKEVLHDCATRDEMFAKEAELVTEEFVGRNDNYNLLPGGFGGWHVANQSYSPEARKRSLRKAREAQQRLRKADPTYDDARRANIHKVRMEALASGKLSPPTFEGRKHTPESKAKMSASCRATSLGERNSQFGTAWVCKAGEKPCKVKKFELDAWLAGGWQRGRRVH